MNKIRLFNDFPLPALATAVPARSIQGTLTAVAWRNEIGKGEEHDSS